MPELPDIVINIEALKKGIGGEVLERVRPAEPGPSRLAGYNWPRNTDEVKGQVRLAAWPPVDGGAGLRGAGKGGRDRDLLLCPFAVQQRGEPGKVNARPAQMGEQGR